MTNDAVNGPVIPGVDANNLSRIAMRKIIIIGGVVVVVAAGGYVLINNRSAGNGAATAGTGAPSVGRAAQAPVRTTMLDKGPVDLPETHTGTMYPKKSVNIHFENQG